MEIMPTHFFRFFIFFEVMISLCLMDGGRMSFLSANFHCRGGVGVIHFFFFFGSVPVFIWFADWRVSLLSLSPRTGGWWNYIHVGQRCVFSPTCRPDPQKFVNGPPASTVDKICCFFFFCQQLFDFRGKKTTKMMAIWLENVRVVLVCFLSEFGQLTFISLNF